MNVKQAIEKRHSTRVFSEKQITKEVLELIVQFGYKIPSAGNLRPIELNAIYFDKPPVFIIICADFKKTCGKYGDRGIRYVYMEAGHVAQNICLVCEEMGIGTCCVGAFNDEEIKKKYNLTDDPIYMVAIGYPK
jgi:nitroreductase